MYDRSFFRSRLGQASLVSIVAMLAMNLVALNAQLQAVPQAYAAASVQVQLA